MAIAAQSGSALRVSVVPPANVPDGPIDVRLTDCTSQTQHTVRIENSVVAGFEALPAGRYDLTVEMAGAVPAAGEIQVVAGWGTAVAVSLAAAGAGASHVAVVDRYRSGEGADFDDRMLRDLPGADNVWSLIETAAPFVVLDCMDTGGLGTGRSALMGSRGDSWALTTVTLDGLSVRQPNETGQLAVAPDMNAMAAISVTSGLAPVEMDSPGVGIGLVARRPGRVWQGGVDASFTAPRMVGENALPHAPSIGRVTSWGNTGVFAGGPMAPRTGLFISAATSRVEHEERGLPSVFTARASTLSAHLVSNPGIRDQIRVVAGIDRTDAPFDHRQQFLDSRVNQRGNFARAQVTWDHIGASGGRRTLAFGAQSANWIPDVASTAAGGTMDRVLHGAVPPPAADTVLTQWDGRFEWAAAPMRRGRLGHDLRAGVSARRTTLGNEIVALPVVAESVAGLPARVWTPAAPATASVRSQHDVAIYATDRVVIGSNFTLDLGARAEVVQASAQDATAGIRWTSVVPRVAFRWSPAAIAVFGGFGQYVGGHALSFLAYGDPGEATWQVRRWDDDDLNGRFDAGEAGVLVARAGRGPSVASLDSDLRAPRTTEWSIGAEVRLNPRSMLRGAIVLRRQTNLVGVVNTGVPLSSYRASFIPDINSDEGSAHDDQLLPIYERLPSSFGQDALVLTNPKADSIAHDGIELTYTFSSSRWFLLFGATTYRTLGWGGSLGHGVFENDQLVLGDRFWNPNATKDEYGRLFFDRAYVGKVSAGYRAPGDVRVATSVRYQDGQPFTRFVVAPDFAGGPEIVHAYAMGRTRFTYTATVDLRLEKGFSFGRHRAAVRLDAFNLTNHANEVEEDVVSGPAFRLSSAVQPPRTLRLGLRFEF